MFDRRLTAVRAKTFCQAASPRTRPVIQLARPAWPARCDSSPGGRAQSVLPCVAPGVRLRGDGRCDLRPSAGGGGTRSVQPKHQHRQRQAGPQGPGRIAPAADDCTSRPPWIQQIHLRCRTRAAPMCASPASRARCSSPLVVRAIPAHRRGTARRPQNVIRSSWGSLRTSAMVQKCASPVEMRKG